MASKLSATYVKVVYGSVASSFTSVVSAQNRLVRVAIITNNTNQDIELSMDGASTFLYVKAYASVTLDLFSNQLDWHGLVYMKYSASAPSAGEVTFTYLVGLD